MRPGSTLTSVDTEPEYQRVARKAFQAAGFAQNQCRLILGRALDVLPRLSDGAYDMVFCDADPRDYQDYLSAALRLLRTGGVVAFNNALLAGSSGDDEGDVPAYDLASQRVMEILQAFPDLILAMAISVAIGTGLPAVIIAIAITRLPFGGRVIRSVAISVREMSYVEAGRASGASAFRIMRLHVLPQCVAPYLVLATTHLGVAIVIEAALGFLGVGVPPPTATWGNMLADSITGLVPQWWLVLFPGLAITVTVLAFNLLGDGIRDTLDPRLSPGFLRLVTGAGRSAPAAAPTLVTARPGAAS